MKIDEIYYDTVSETFYEKSAIEKFFNENKDDFTDIRTVDEYIEFYSEELIKIN